MADRRASDTALVSALCAEAKLPVAAEDLPNLAASYAMLVEGIESLKELDYFGESPCFTIIDPRDWLRSS